MRPFMIALLGLGCSAQEPDVQPQQKPNIVVLESDYTTGIISGWSDDFKATLGSIPSGGDARLIALQNGFALLERSRSDAVTFFDHSLSFQRQIALPERSNPHDLIEVNNSYWISLYQRAELLRFSSATYQPQSAIDGISWTDEDDRPEASAMHISATGHVFLLVQNLDFTGVEPIPPEHSQLIEFSSSGELIKQHQIPSNPFGSVIERADGRLNFACNRSWEIDQQAGLWQYDPVQETGEFLIEETRLNGNILDFEWFEGRIYLLVSNEDFSTSLYEFNPETDALTAFTGPHTQAIGCIEHVDQTLFVCDRTLGLHGIRRIDQTQLKLDDQLIKTTLAPLQILVPLAEL